MTESRQLEIFDTWIKGNKGLFFKIIRAYAREPDDQQDLFQEIMLQVWRSVPVFREESAVSTWLYRVALNTSIKWMRREKRFTDNRRPLEHAHAVLQETASNDRLTWLYEQIHALNEVDRSITLLLLDGFSYKEMAAILGISETNVGVKINRIKKYLIEQTNKPQ